MQISNSLSFWRGPFILLKRPIYLTIVDLASYFIEKTAVIQRDFHNFHLHIYPDWHYQYQCPYAFSPLTTDELLLFLIKATPHLHTIFHIFLLNVVLYQFFPTSSILLSAELYDLHVSILLFFLSSLLFSFQVLFHSSTLP